VATSGLRGHAQERTDALALDGLAHVALRVSDIPTSREFYGMLGFEQAFEFSDARGLRVSYVKVNDRQYIELYRRDTAAQPLGLMHLCFDTSDIQRLAEAYQKRGLTTTDFRKASAGNQLFNLRDPEGQTLEYTQYLPGSLHSNDRGHHLGEHRISVHLVCASIQAQDPPAERAYFTDKLGFQEVRGSPTRLRLPGQSGEAIEIQAVAAGAKPRLEFEVADVRRAGEELRARGLTVSTQRSSVLIRDPGGTEIVFIRRGR
jgi:catechol 2,3-dioxygenase-like lactoylglutathione lyase family enzyme